MRGISFSHLVQFSQTSGQPRFQDAFKHPKNTQKAVRNCLFKKVCK